MELILDGVKLMVIGMFFFADAGWMQYMRTHVYTQGGKPILAAFGHYAQVGFAVCAVVWAVLFFTLRSREAPIAARPGASAGRPGRRSLSGVSCWALAPA